MRLVAYLVYVVGVVLAVSWFIGIRLYVKHGQGVTKQTVNITMLFFVSLVLVPALSLSPFHLLWMFPASWILGVCSPVFPLSLISGPGYVLFRLACLGMRTPDTKAGGDDASL